MAVLGEHRPGHDAGLGPGPAEPAIRWRLVEPRQLRTEQRFDLVWARLLDVAAVLSAATFGAAATLTFEVHDPFRPESAGTFRLHVPGRGEAATCERLAQAGATRTSESDLTLAMPDLSSIACGGHRPVDARRRGPHHPALTRSARPRQRRVHHRRPTLPPLEF